MWPRKIDLLRSAGKGNHGSYRQSLPIRNCVTLKFRKVFRIIEQWLSCHACKIAMWHSTESQNKPPEILSRTMLSV